MEIGECLEFFLSHATSQDAERLR